MRITRWFSVLAVVFLLPLHSFRSAVRGTNPDLERIRASVIHDLVMIPVNAERVARLVQTQAADGSWPEIDYENVSRTGFDHQRHLAYMFELSRAFKQPGNSWYQHPSVKSAALSALDYWLEHDFLCENWWWNEMGTPGRMINTLLVLDGELNERQINQGLRIAGRAHLEASGARPGGDLIQIADMLGKQALFRRDETVLAQVTKVMAEEVKVTTGRGIKPDMSFHHRVDNVISTLSYGRGYASSFAYWAEKVAGTRYAFSDRAVELVVDYFLDGMCKSMVHARYPDPGASNRELSRRGSLRAMGPGIAEQLLRVTDYRRVEMEQVADIQRGVRQPELSGSRFFWHSEYFTHQRPGWFASVRMHSSRNHTVESPHNGEGLKNHHLGDGANYVSRRGDEYYNIFPFWDWQKIPGATVVQKPELPPARDIARRGLTDFVGGVTDGHYGAIAFDFSSAHDRLQSRKSWFFFDDEFVCLGSNIASSAEFPVFTTVNQTLLRGPVTARLKRETRTLPQGKHVLFNVGWILHDSIGYVFLKPESVHMSNTRVSGTWKAINHQASSSRDSVSGEVFALWFDHGVGPAGADYQYIVVPDVGPSDLEHYARGGPIAVVENSADLQAVHHRALGRTGATFYKAGKVAVSEGLTVETAQPCVLLAHATRKSLLSLAVADPSRSLDSIQLRTNAFVQNTGDRWEAQWDEKQKMSVIRIDLPDGAYAGESVILNLFLQ